MIAIAHHIHPKSEHLGDCTLLLDQGFPRFMGVGKEDGVLSSLHCIKQHS